MNNIEVELTEEELLDTLSSIKYNFDQLSYDRSRINQCFRTLRNELIRLQRLYCYYGNVLLNRGECCICKREVIEGSIETMKNIKIDDDLMHIYYQSIINDNIDTIKSQGHPKALNLLIKTEIKRFYEEKPADKYPDINLESLL